MPAIALDADGLRRAGDLVRANAGGLVLGETASLELIASVGGPPPPGRGPRAAITSAQTLSPAARTAIEQGLQTRVFDRYATAELGPIAHECDMHRGLHVNAESYIVEILRDGRPAAPGELGDVVVTDLSNLCVPLIRYVTGDRAIASAHQCECGRGLPLIEGLSGRAPSVVVLADGAFVPATYFDRVLGDYGHVVRQFQALQKQPGSLELRVVRGPRYSDKAVQALLERFRDDLGPGLIQAP